MGAGLHDPAALEHDDPVGPAHGREPVRHHDRGQPGGEVEEAVVEGRFGPHVEVGRRLVEDEDPGAALQGEHGPGQRHPLPLPAGEVGAAVELLRQDRVPVVRQGLDQLHDPGALAGLDAGLVVGRPAGVAEDDVLPQGERVLGELLEDGGDAALPGPLVDLGQVDAVDRDAALRRLVEAAQQVHQRGLAGAVLPDDGQRLPGPDQEVEIGEDGPVGGGVGEGDALHPDGLDRGPAGVADPRGEGALGPLDLAFDGHHVGDGGGPHPEDVLHLGVEPEAGQGERHLEVDEQLADAELAVEGGPDQRPEDGDVGGEEYGGGEQGADAAPAPAGPDLAHAGGPLALEPVEQPRPDPEDAGLLGRRAAEDELADILRPAQRRRVALHRGDERAHLAPVPGPGAEPGGEEGDRRPPVPGEEDHAGRRRRQPDGGQVVEGTEGLLGGEVLRAHLLGQAQPVGDVGVFEVADRDRPQQRGHDPLLDEDREPVLEALDRRAEEGEGDPLDEEDGGDGAEGDPWRGAAGGAGLDDGVDQEADGHGGADGGGRLEDAGQEDGGDSAAVGLPGQADQRRDRSSRQGGAHATRAGCVHKWSVRGRGPSVLPPTAGGW